MPFTPIIYSCAKRFYITFNLLSLTYERNFDWYVRITFLKLFHLSVQSCSSDQQNIYISLITQFWINVVGYIFSSLFLSLWRSENNVKKSLASTNIF